MIENTATAKADRKRRARAQAQRRPAWWFVLPAAAFYVFVVVAPGLQGVVYSFTDWNGINLNFDFIGFDNYVRLVNDPIAQGAIVHTLIIAAGITIIQVGLGLVLALALHTQIRGRNIYRALFFAPVLIMPIVTSYLWKYILGTTGPLNQILDGVGLGFLKQAWLGEQETALTWIILVSVWQGCGVSMAIFLAGLESIPVELLEASELDGAGRISKFRNIMLPLLGPAMSVSTLLVLISSIRSFDQVWILTQGGPAYKTDTLATRMYASAFQLGEFSYGVTFAVVLALIVAVLAIIQQQFVRRRDALV